MAQADQAAEGTILVVDDEWLIAEDVRLRLRRLGYPRVETAHSLSRAIAALQNARPVAALVDLELQGVLTFEVTDALMQWGVPFAVMTGHLREIFPERLGRFPVLEKPFADTDLQQVMSQLLWRCPEGSPPGPETRSSRAAAGAAAWKETEQGDSHGQADACNPGTSPPGDG